MKFKSIFLLLIFSCSLVPLNPVQAEEVLQRSPEDAVALMYISDAVLLNEIVDDESISTSKVSASTKPDISADETTDLINQMINATKQQRNDHDRKCRETVEIYRQQGKTCEVDQTNAYCKSKRAELTAKIAALRKKRGGDNRKWFTKQWHGIKRAGARFWHKIGPLGRNFLREVGPQALKIVLAGGPGTEALLKNLLKHTAKNMARQRVKQIGIQALQRILKVQIEVATAAGVDICQKTEKIDSEEKTTVQEKPSGQSTEDITVSFSFNEVSITWPSLFPPQGKFHSCGALPSVFKFDPVSFNIVINPNQSTLSADISGSYHGEDIYDGVLLTDLNKEFEISINSPYTREVIAEGRAWSLNSEGNLKVKVWGKTMCHYYEVIDNGDPIYHEYWVENNKTVSESFPFFIRLYTEDNENLDVSVYLFHEWGEFDHLTLYTARQVLPYTNFDAIINTFDD